MEKPEEIKMGLRCYALTRGHIQSCSDCAYHGRGLPPCRVVVHQDALAYIEQLETQLREVAER